jgi:two-component system, OmpR family, phosphate regulon sensor histidine kinase PhoR
MSGQNISRFRLSRVTLQLWQAYDENKDAALQKDRSIRVCQTNASVTSKKTLLNVILRNLVSTAIKYTKPGGGIPHGYRRSGDEVRIDVCDTGIGIAQEQLPRIFKAFNHLDSARCVGLGPGLFVVRRAIGLCHEYRRSTRRCVTVREMKGGPLRSAIRC